MQLHNFKAEDFAKYHPGALWAKIIARVKDMLKHFKTYGFPDTPIKKVILKSQRNV
jgi:arabinose-5-phosphate isomerase